MSAKIEPNYDKKRQNLAGIIPLEAPFTVYIEQTKYCNFKCYYCMHSTRDNPNGIFSKLGHKVQHMKKEVFEKTLQDLKSLGVKRIVFSGLGEPLMNPEFPTLVKQMVNAKIAERIEVITNGMLLTPEYTEKLINSGITNINISIQGVNKDDYKRNCGIDIDFDNYVNNIKYLYRNKKNTTIYIKAIDAVFKNEIDKQKFLDIFSDSADKIYIEHLVVMQQSMDNLHEIVDADKNMYGEVLNKKRQVCAQCFYFLQIGVDGRVYPCSIPGVTADFAIGNIMEKSLNDIWNDEKRSNFLYTMLDFKRDTIPQCKECSCFNCVIDSREYLDDDAYRLKEHFKQRNNK